MRKGDAAAMQTSNLSLYHYDGCPYCGFVREALERLGMDIELRNIHADADRRRELVEATGRQMVPCLRIEEGPLQVRWMHESRDIIEYLESLKP